MASCQDDHLNGSEIKEKMAERRLYHIDEVQLLTGAQTVGTLAVKLLDSAQCADSTLPCTTAVATAQKTLADQEITASRLSFDAWQPKKDLPKVKEVLDALQYSHSQGQSIPPNLQKDGQKGFHYVEGITVNKHQCLSCHKTWKMGQEVGIYNIRFGSRPAVKEASKGLKGMN